MLVIVAQRPFENSTLSAICRDFLRFRCSRTQCTLRSGSRKPPQLTRQSEFSNGLSGQQQRFCVVQVDDLCQCGLSLGRIATFDGANKGGVGFQGLREVDLRL